MSPISDGMVLAAGLGLRMRPLTEHLPKPLLQVGHETLLDHALRTLAEGGVRRAVVNGHYRADQIIAHLDQWQGGLDLSFSDERSMLLETGGGVAKALPMLTGEAFFVLNADNIWVPGRMPVLDALHQLWQPEVMDGLLLLVPLARGTGYDGFGDFRMDGLGRLERRVAPRVAPFAFAGAQILKRSLFDGEPVEPFSLNRIYNKALAEGRLYGTAHGGPWYHVGSPDGLSLAQAGLGFDAAG
jgi:N-acetyl-alpha-D-muramate 1-phosphate uridylyltransferase